MIILAKRCKTVVLVGAALAFSLGQTCVEQNQLPVVTVGADQTVDPGVTVQLDGSASIDPDGNALTFAWAQAGGDVVSLSGNDTAVASFVTPLKAADAIYAFQLTVSDGTGSAVSRIVSVTVRAVPPPTASAGPDQTVDEVTTVTLDGAATGLNATVVWEVPADSGVTLSSVSDLKATFDAPNVDGDNSVTLTLKVTDVGGRTASDTVTINIKDLFSTGLLVPDPSELDLLPQALNPTVGANLPASVSLVSKLPPVGNQANLGSCTAWATAYAGATYSYQITTGDDVSGRDNQASPTYIYYQALQLQGSKCGNGTDMLKASDILVKTGTPSLQSLPYSDQCLPSTPSSAGGDRFRIGTYKRLGNGRDSIRNELAAGRIVVFGAYLNTNFIKPPSGIYRGNGQFLPGGQQHSAHAMAIVGYDDVKGAFQVMNSWGTGWGESGFVWWAYDSIEKLVFAALSYTPRNGTGPNGGGGGGGANCKSGYQPAINNSSVCCPVDYPYIYGDGYCHKTAETGSCPTGYKQALNNSNVCCTDAYPYDGGDGHCYKTPPPGDDNCSPGYSPAKNYPSICCGDGYPYYGSDKLCHINDPSQTCKAGSSLAVNNSKICCPNGFPYYGFSDNQCHTTDPNPVTCSMGYAPAVNNSGICCANGYPYYGKDGLCHTTNPDPVTCSTGYAPPLNNPAICCPNDYPYYNSSDKRCYKTNPNPASCSAGSSPALNDTTVCCPNGFPYYSSADKKCHTVNPNPVTCPTGSAPAVNNTTTCCPTGFPYDLFNGYCGKTPKTSRKITDNSDEAVPQSADAGVGPRSPLEDSPTADTSTQPPDEPAVIGDELPPVAPAFLPPGGGDISDARAYQVLDEEGDGSINVKLVFEGALMHPISLTQVKLVDPNCVEVTQDYHAAFGNGYVYFERRDGRQWLAGQYLLEMTGTTDGEQEVIYSTTVAVAALATHERGLSAAQTVLGASRTMQVPVGDRPVDVTGDNGHPALVSGD